MYRGAKILMEYVEIYTATSKMGLQGMPSTFLEKPGRVSLCDPEQVAELCL